MLTYDDLPLYRARIIAARRLRPLLSRYHAILHAPCELCGCVLFCEVLGGFRCLRCMPPLNLGEQHRRLLAELIGVEPVMKGGEEDADAS